MNELLKLMREHGATFTYDKDNDCFVIDCQGTHSCFQGIAAHEYPAGVLYVDPCVEAVKRGLESREETL